MNTYEECTTLGTEVNSQHLKGYVYWFVIVGFHFYCVKINKYQDNIQESWENPGRAIFGNFQTIHFLKMPYSNLKKKMQLV